MTCTYHDQARAHWVCPSCARRLCRECIDRDARMTTALCPLCGIPLERHHDSQGFPPPWRSLAVRLRYPVTRNGAGMIIVWPSLMTLAVAAGLLGIPLGGLLLILALRYWLLVLESSAHGYLEPPAVSAELLLGGFAAALTMFAVATGLANLSHFPPLAAFPALTQAIELVVFLLVPAIAARYALMGLHPGVLAPRGVIGLIRTLGPFYGVLLGALEASRRAGLQAVASWFQPMPGYEILVIHGVAWYLATLTAHWIGYSLYFHHRTLGFQPQRLGQPTPEEWPTEQPPLGAVRVLLAEGETAAARDRLERMLAYDSRSPIQALYHGVLLDTGQGERLLEHAPGFLNRALSEGDWARATQIVIDCAPWGLAVPTDLDHFRPLALRLRERRQFDRALALAQRLSEIAPDHPDIPELARMAATILLEDREPDPQRAHRAIDFGLQRARVPSTTRAALLELQARADRLATRGDGQPSDRAPE